jgi:hypothetical protein
VVAATISQHRTDGAIQQRPHLSCTARIIDYTLNEAPQWRRVVNRNRVEVVADVTTNDIHAARARAMRDDTSHVACECPESPLVRHAGLVRVEMRRQLWRDVLSEPVRDRVMDDQFDERKIKQTAPLAVLFEPQHASWSRGTTARTEVLDEQLRKGVAIAMDRRE